MAKAKKSEETTEKKTTKAPAKAEAKAPASAKAATEKPAAKAETPKKSAAKKTPAAAPATPAIDTSLAAQAAASMLVHRDSIENAAAPKKEESAAFKNLKDQLAKPKPASLSHLLGGGAAAKKAGPHFNLNQQRGHNQTFNAFNKTGVPRRTNG